MKISVGIHAKIGAEVHITAEDWVHLNELYPPTRLKRQWMVISSSEEVQVRRTQFGYASARSNKVGYAIRLFEHRPPVVRHADTEYEAEITEAGLLVRLPLVHEWPWVRKMALAGECDRRERAIIELNARMASREQAGLGRDIFEDVPQHIIESLLSFQVDQLQAGKEVER